MGDRSDGNHWISIKTLESGQFSTSEFSYKKSPSPRFLNVWSTGLALTEIDVDDTSGPVHKEFDQPQPRRQEKTTPPFIS